jgi:hypothetical protein
VSFLAPGLVAFFFPLADDAVLDELLPDDDDPDDDEPLSLSELESNYLIDTK